MSDTIEEVKPKDGTAIKRRKKKSNKIRKAVPVYQSLPPMRFIVNTLNPLVSINISPKFR